jgi:ABC-2 type transport system permease protein
VVNRRCQLRGLSPEVLTELRRRVPSEHLVLGAAEEERVRKKSDFVAELMLPFAFMFLMFMGIFGIGQHMLTSIIEEKNSRVMELLLSALSPFQLMSGKVLGLAGIGLTVISVWGAGAYAAARWRGLALSVPAGILPYFIIYYILGFLLFSSVLAGIGSVCNTIKEAQGLMMPVSLLCIVPMVSWFTLVKDPHGTLARSLSFVPPLTPMVMIVRLSAKAELPLLEVVASIVVLAGFVPVVVWAGAKVFRTGILMFGKRPGLREILRWIRQH